MTEKDVYNGMVKNISTISNTQCLGNRTDKMANFKKERKNPDLPAVYWRREQRDTPTV